MMPCLKIWFELFLKKGEVSGRLRISSWPILIDDNSANYATIQAWISSLLDILIKIMTSPWPSL